MHPRPGSLLQRPPRANDVFAAGARQAGDGRILDRASDLAHRLEIAVRRDRKTGLDDVDAHLLERPGDPQFFLEVHRTAGRLLAITQRGVENVDAGSVGGGSGLGFGIGGHGFVSYADGVSGLRRASLDDPRPPQPMERSAG